MHEVFFEKLSCFWRGTWPVNRFVLTEFFEEGQCSVCDGRMPWYSCKVETDWNRGFTTFPPYSNYVPIKPPLLCRRGKRGAEEMIEHLTRWESNLSILQRRAAVTAATSRYYRLTKQKQINRTPTKGERDSSILQRRVAVWLLQLLQERAGQRKR